MAEQKRLIRRLQVSVLALGSILLLLAVMWLAFDRKGRTPSGAGNVEARLDGTRPAERAGGGIGSVLGLRKLDRADDIIDKLKDHGVVQAVGPTDSDPLHGVKSLRKIYAQKYGEGYLLEFEKERDIFIYYDLLDGHPLTEDQKAGLANNDDPGIFLYGRFVITGRHNMVAAARAALR